MRNLGDMMKKAQDMQQRLGEMKNNLGATEISGQSGGGMVQITLDGNGVTKSVKLDPKIVDPSDVSMLEDLIVAAYNDSHGKIQSHVEAETQKIMGGIQMPPGFKLPF